MSDTENDRAEQGGVVNQLKPLIIDWRASARQFESDGNDRAAGAIEACAGELEEVIDEYE